jgi:hypothetical protein
MKKMPEKKLTSDPPSQAEIVTLAVYHLGGSQRAIDTEDVAVEAHKLAPGRFSWRKYPDQINLELIRVYLSDAKIKHDLLLGSGKTGWRLTQRGLEWCEQAAGSVGVGDTSRTRAQSRSGSIDEQRWRRERSRLLGTHAWTLWSSGERTIPISDAKEVFRIDSYAKGSLLEAKLTRMRAMFTHDSELAPFLNHLAEQITGEGKL